MLEMQIERDCYFYFPAVTEDRKGIRHKKCHTAEKRHHFFSKVVSLYYNTEGVISQ